jgi:hypothetical protein
MPAANASVTMTSLSISELAAVTGGNKWTALGEAADYAVTHAPALGRSAETILEQKIKGIRDLTGVSVNSIRKMIATHGIDKVESSAWQAVRNRIAK